METYICSVWSPTFGHDSYQVVSDNGFAGAEERCWERLDNETDTHDWEILMIEKETK